MTKKNNKDDIVFLIVVTILFAIVIVSTIGYKNNYNVKNSCLIEDLECGEYKNETRSEEFITIKQFEKFQSGELLLLDKVNEDKIFHRFFEHNSTHVEWVVLREKCT